MFICRCPKCRQCAHDEAVKAGWNPAFKCDLDYSKDCDPNIAPQCDNKSSASIIVAIICVLSFIFLITQL